MAACAGLSSTSAARTVSSRIRPFSGSAAPWAPVAWRCAPKAHSIAQRGEGGRGRSITTCRFASAIVSVVRSAGAKRGLWPMARWRAARAVKGGGRLERRDQGRGLVDRGLCGFDGGSAVGIAQRQTGFFQPQRRVGERRPAAAGHLREQGGRERAGASANWSGSSERV
jgi:hypothetical protein